MSDKYIYAIARIRSMETRLFNKQTMNRLLGESSYKSAVSFIKEKGWGEDQMEDSDQILSYERDRLWKDIKGMIPDMKPFDVLVIQNRYHNLKAAIKVAVEGDTHADVFYGDQEPSGRELVEMIRSGKFDRLPPEMKDIAREAFESITHTGNGQIADILIDRETLEQIKKVGGSSSDHVMRNYARMTVCFADIKTAYRASLTGKSRNFLEKALCPAEGLDKQAMINAAMKGPEEFLLYIAGTDYQEAADMLKTGFASYEKWCDDRIIEMIKPEKFNSFTMGAIAAYILARLNEIKTVRIILSGKKNNIPEDVIRRRVREMYV